MGPVTKTIFTSYGLMVASIPVLIVFAVVWGAYINYARAQAEPQIVEVAHDTIGFRLIPGATIDFDDYGNLVASIYQHGLHWRVRAHAEMEHLRDALTEAGVFSHVDSIHLMVYDEGGRDVGACEWDTSESLDAMICVAPGQGLFY